jgi:ERCC4-type nuclease
MLVAPTEPRTIKSLGKSSSVPEKWGADIFFSANGSLVGVQRKEISDLIASVQDGRLAKEMSQMQNLGLAVLVVEGRLKWSSDGVLLGRDYGITWTRTAHRNLLMSVQARGVKVESTDDAADTVCAVLNLQEWARKPSHHGLMRRPGPVSPWGKAQNEDWASHLLQGFEGVGPELAKNILQHFGGRVPLEWRVDEKALRAVKGLGPKRARALIAALEGDQQDPATKDED